MELLGIIIMRCMCSDLLGRVKNNHIFSCSGDDEEVTCLTLRQSNLNNHAASTHKVSKRSRKFRSPAEVATCLDESI